MILHVAEFWLPVSINRKHNRNETVSTWAHAFSETETKEHPQIFPLKFVSKNEGDASGLERANTIWQQRFSYQINYEHYCRLKAGVGQDVRIASEMICRWLTSLMRKRLLFLKTARRRKGSKFVLSTCSLRLSGRNQVENMDPQQI